MSTVHLAAPGGAGEGYGGDCLAAGLSAVKDQTAAVGLDRTMAQKGRAFRYNNIETLPVHPRESKSSYGM